eukprot:m.126935 g.126935  ORF g.126935 m.126935 type:complete len:70 (+) comp14532_c0_seq1:3163-3372(+)
MAAATSPRTSQATCFQCSPPSWIISYYIKILLFAYSFCEKGSPFLNLHVFVKVVHVIMFHKLRLSLCIV